MFNPFSRSDAKAAMASAQQMSGVRFDQRDAALPAATPAR